MAKSKTPTGKTQMRGSLKSVPAKRSRVNAKRTTIGAVETMTKYAVPGAALLGSGLLAATGILLRGQLERLFRAALKSAAAGGASARDVTAEQLDLQKLLAHVGLQRKRSPAIAAALGAFAGLIAGSALATWLAPVVRKELAPSDVPNASGNETGLNHAMPHATPSA